MSIRRDGSLHIERVTVQDEGQYTCVADNVAGASNRTTNIHVYGKMGLTGYFLMNTILFMLGK